MGRRRKRNQRENETSENKFASKFLAASELTSTPLTHFIEKQGEVIRLVQYLSKVSFRKLPKKF